MNNPSSEKPVTEQIDEIINEHDQWKQDLLTKLRTTILSVDTAITEEVKWKMRTRPLGLPVWMDHGILCFAEIWKDNIKLLFPKGAWLKDGHSIFNSRLESKDIRAIEYKQDSDVNDEALRQLVRAAQALNNSGNKK